VPAWIQNIPTTRDKADTYLVKPLDALLRQLRLRVAVRFVPGRERVEDGGDVLGARRVLEVEPPHDLKPLAHVRRRPHRDGQVP
jgi:hypothetical protein